jgi:hypothetical protein
MEEVVSHVIAYVAKDPSAVNCCGNMPVPVENDMGKFPKRSGQDHEESWRHHKSVLIHGEIVVNAV